MPTRRIHRSTDSDHQEEEDRAAGPRSNGEKKEPAKSKGGIWQFLLIVLLTAAMLGILLALGVFGQRGKKKDREQTSRDVQAGAQAVQVVKPSKSPPVFDFSLPGGAEALTTATLYARVNGYLKSRLVDIGDRVQEGQLLAEIDAPDIDAQYNQARAQLEQNRAALGIAKVTFGRQKRLLDEKVVSRQESDQSEAAYNQAIANVKASEANVQNLGAQQGFKRITAPFAGVVTTRYVDTGALISNGGSAAASLLTIAQTDTLRVFINVPQSYVASVKPGQDVQVTLPEYPGQIFHGKVTRTADALDIAARTERVEIQLPSENGKLLPGMYLAVRFKVQQAVDALILPSNTLDIRKEGPRVATVGANQKILYKKVTLGRDFGKTTEILDGLDGNENIVVNPTPELVDGERVDIAKDDKKESGESAPAGQEKK